MPAARDLTSTRRPNPNVRPLEPETDRTPANSNNAGSSSANFAESSTRSPNLQPLQSPSKGFSSATSPILNTLSNLRSRLTNSPRTPPTGSIAPTPPGYEHQEDESGQDDGGTGKRKPGWDGSLEPVRGTYPSRLSARQKSKGEPAGSSSRETRFDSRGYPLKNGNGSSKPSPIVGPPVSYPPEPSPRKAARDLNKIYGRGVEDLSIDDSRQSSVISLAPTFQSTYTAGPTTSTSHLLPPGAAPPLEPAFVLGSGPEAGPSRPSSISSDGHSPMGSFSSDAPFGARDAWGSRQTGNGDARKGKARFLGVNEYETGASGSAISLGTLDARLTMGREINTRGFEGLGGRYSLPLDPAVWDQLGPEPDDDFHEPARSDFTRYRPGAKQTIIHMFSLRSISNLGCVFVLIMALTALFAIWPIVKSQVDRHKGDTAPKGGYNVGGINGTGQVPVIPGHFTLIDRSTPESALKHISLETGEEWDLIFSDEFNEEGRTFWPGDDPFWEAGDQHYWSTNNLEWYDPRMITTENGHLKITLDKIENHGLQYSGGLMTTWNKFCYTGGYFEASLSLPGTSSVYGLWPAVWTLGNLGRAGYGGTLDGMWPYSYNECDVGTLKNQSKDGLPEIAFTSGDEAYNYTLSYLPGQRLSACTCPNDETHPGPRDGNGGFVGRSAPEIDMIEAQVDQWTREGHVSQSAQWAPFNPYYSWINTSATYEIYNDDVVHLNSYQGGHYQQATSAYAITDQDCYTGNTGCMSVYGFEYGTGDDGYITWVNDGAKSWTIRTGALGPNEEAQIGYRQIPVEPMYLIINLGISENFGAVDYEGLESLWPTTMLVDYVRLYQDPGKLNIGCDPEDYPTAAYIERYKEAYNNPNISTWEQASGGLPFPKNRLIDTC